jgi:tRNA pseudouridine13 synthase
LYVSALPYATSDLPGTGGKIRESPKDFIVEEIPVFEPMDTGEHLFVNLTKEGISTRRLASELALLFDLPRTAVGYAGLKDVRSVSTQTFSLHLGLLTEYKIHEIGSLIESSLPVTVNCMRSHPRKLRAGQLLGNKFSINITGLSMEPEEALSRAKKITYILGSKGLPNFYGYQRVDVENVRRGYDIIKGVKNRKKVRSRWLRRFLVSSYLDYLCNLYLIERFHRGDFYRILEGDIAKKHSTGGMFLVDDPERESTRFETGEISFTAPIFGPRMWWAEGPSGELEKEVFDKSDITLDELRRLGVRGSRRMGRVLPKIVIQIFKRGLNVCFNLSKGAYATVVLREIMKNV